MLKRTIIAATALAIAATAIAAPAAYAGPSAPTLGEAHCFHASPKWGTPDLLFDGGIGEGNAVLVGGPASGAAPFCGTTLISKRLTIVAAKSQVVAKAKCDVWGLGSAVGRLNKDWGYTDAPADYWLCAAPVSPAT